MADNVAELVKVEGLIPHVLNEKIYGNSLPSERFVESIKLAGVLTPIVLAADRLTIISGRRRVAACVMLGKTSIMAFVREDLSDPVDIALEVLESNEFNEDTIEQKTRRWQELTALRYAKLSEKTLDAVVDIQGDVAREMGSSRSTMQRVTRVLKRSDALRERGMYDEAVAVNNALNTIGVAAAEETLKTVPNMPCAHDFKDDECVKCGMKLPGLDKIRKTVKDAIPTSALSADLKAKMPKPAFKPPTKPPGDDKRKMAREALDATAVFRAVSKDIDSVMASVLALSETPYGVFLADNTELIRSSLNEAKMVLMASQPHVFCPECNGIGCHVCEKRGWLTKLQHDTFVEFK